MATDKDIDICSAELQLRNKFEILEAWQHYLAQYFDKLKTFSMKSGAGAPRYQCCNASD